MPLVWLARLSLADGHPVRASGPRPLPGVNAHSPSGRAPAHRSAWLTCRPPSRSRAQPHRTQAVQASPSAYFNTPSFALNKRATVLPAQSSLVHTSWLPPANHSVRSVTRACACCACAGPASCVIAAFPPPSQSAPCPPQTASTCSHTRSQTWSRRAACWTSAHSS
jgi:hypothetical protein